MAGTSKVTFNVDTDIKNRFVEVAASYGMTLTRGLELVMKDTATRGDFPFEIDKDLLRAPRQIGLADRRAGIRNQVSRNDVPAGRSYQDIDGSTPTYGQEHLR